MIAVLKKNWALALILGIVAYILSKADSLMDGPNDGRGSVDEKPDLMSSLSDLQAESLAERFFNAMSGMGTDEAEIKSTFKLIRSLADYNKVYNKFGIRQYSQFWGNVGDPVTSGQYDLTTWLRNELSQEEISEMDHLRIL